MFETQFIYKHKKVIYNVSLQQRIYEMDRLIPA